MRNVISGFSLAQMSKRRQKKFREKYLETGLYYGRVNQDVYVRSFVIISDYANQPSIATGTVGEIDA